jgi:sulfide:quinone oxidoreductase
VRPTADPQAPVTEWDAGMTDLSAPGRRSRVVSSREPLEVLIAGGGVAAIETLLALRVLAHARVRVTLLSTTAEFLYRPVTVAEPFDRAQARTYDLAEIAADQGAQLIVDELARVEPGAHRVLTRSGRHVRFDVLVVATGARAVASLPGAVTFGGRESGPAMRALLDGVCAGAIGSVAFALPAESIWPVPLYELALMTGARARAAGARPELTIVTPEPAPLAVFGPAAAGALEDLLDQRRIAMRTLALPERVEPDALVLAGGRRIAAERVVTVPRVAGRPIHGLPADDRGFIAVDGHGRVRGMADVYSAGDATAFPLKQGGLAAQQADAVAEAIAARAGADVDARPFHPVLRGLLLVGGAPLYLRAEAGRLPQHVVIGRDAYDAAELSTASAQALWWPPGKVAGRYLAPYLATARPAWLGAEPLADRAPVGRTRDADPEHEDALQLTLALADADARWGDHASALRALDSAEALAGALPPDYEHKRAEWLAAVRGHPRPEAHV